MNELEARLQQDLRTAAQNVRVSGDAWQENQRRLISVSKNRRIALRIGALTSVAAASIAIVVGISLVTISDRGTERQRERPASGTADLGPASLLIADELPINGAWDAQVDDESQATPTTACHPGGIETLKPEKTWYRSFPGKNPEDSDNFQARQVTAEFASAEAAADAFEAVGGWFDRCPDLRGDVRRWPVLTAAGGRAQTVELTRAQPGDPSRQQFELAGYAVNGAALTLVVITIDNPDLAQGQSPFGADFTKPTMTFALQRLAGTRTTTANAVPASFRFVEERTDPTWRADEGGSQQLFVERLTSLTLADVELCQELTPAPVPQIDATAPHLKSSEQAVGMTTVGRSAAARHHVSRALILYTDVAAAQAAAGEIRAHMLSCAGKEAWKVSAKASDADATFVAGKRTDTFNVAFAYVQRGNAVIIATGRSLTDAAFSGRDVAEPPGRLEEMVEDVRKSVHANIEPVCEIATGC